VDNAIEKELLERLKQGTVRKVHIYTLHGTLSIATDRNFTNSDSASKVTTCGGLLGDIETRVLLLCSIRSQIITVSKSVNVCVNVLLLISEIAIHYSGLFSGFLLVFPLFLLVW